jgi:hypothetical protein
MRPNRPHIPSSILNVKERTQRQKRLGRQFPSVSLPASSSDFPAFRVVLAAAIASLSSVTVTLPLR